MSSEDSARHYRVVLFAVSVVAGVGLVAVAAKPLLVLFGGVLFALVLRALADAVSRISKIRYEWCLAAVVAALVAAGVVSLVAVGPSLRDQLRELATRLPAAAHDALEQVRHEPIGQVLAPPPSAASASAMAANGATAALGTMMEIASGLVVVFFVGVYGALRPGDYGKAILGLAPAIHRERVRAMLVEISRTLTRWLFGRLAAMVFVGATCAVAFALLGVPLPLALGVLAGLLAFVEYAGALVSAIPPLLFAFAKGPATALAVLLVFTGVHVVEGYVITPLVARASVRFPPAFTLAGQVVLAALVGVLGLTFSTPLLVVAVVAIRTWRGYGGHQDI